MVLALEYKMLEDFSTTCEFCLKIQNANERVLQMTCELFSQTCGFGFEHTRVKTTSFTGDQWICPLLVDLASNIQESKNEFHR